MTTRLNGAALVAGEERFATETFRATDATSGALLDGAFAESGPAEVEAACLSASAAAIEFAESVPERRATLLESLGAEIIALGDALIERAHAETGLPRARLEGERGRTVGQLTFMAKLLRRGDLFEAALDSPIPSRTPLPRPDLRRRNVAVGPVAVFGASNFPLAFSVAGGDSASALAAGCPVVVKGHPAHPGTGELVARAIANAVRRSGLPAGLFSYLPGTRHSLGASLVADPRIRAVGFTGSRAGGLALLKIAAARPEPIPVYAEMSSINPVFLFPAAARNRGAELAKAFVASLTLGAGQFCTNPGVLVGCAGADLDAFAREAAQQLARVSAQPMLSAGIADNYRRGVADMTAIDGVATLARGRVDTGSTCDAAALFAVDARRFLDDRRLAAEVFGASSLIVRAASTADFAQIAAELEGQLTATVLYDAEDRADVARLLPTLERKVGRIIGNGWPTGVEVAEAMVHGGPYPATSDGRTTSVGALAIQRFLRPVCYQDLDDALLPPALRAANPWRLPRRIDGEPEAR